MYKVAYTDRFKKAFNNLSKKLAKYMMPYKLIKLDALPININGKIDKSRDIPSFNVDEVLNPMELQEKSISEDTSPCICRAGAAGAFKALAKSAVNFAGVI